MKDYQNIFEFNKRKKEFGEFFAKSYGADEVIEYITAFVSEEEAKEMKTFLQEQNEFTQFQKEQPQYIAFYQLIALSNYVFRYCAIESFIQTDIDEDGLNELKKHTLDDSSLSTSEIYDFLKTLLPLYAEALLSFIDTTEIDVKERLLETFLNGEKNNFINIIREQRGNIYRLSTVCKYLEDNGINRYLQYIANIAELVENGDWEEIPLEGFKEGELIQAMANAKSDYDSPNEELAIAAAKSFYPELLKIYIKAEKFLTEEQKSQYLQLLRAEGMEVWFDEVYQNCQEEVAQQREEGQEQEHEPHIEVKSKDIELPEDFFTNSKYINLNLPRIPGFITPTNEQMLNILNVMTAYHCIVDDTEAKYKFIRALTGRSAVPCKLEDFEKALWIGSLKRLLFLVRYVAPSVRGKYEVIPNLFDLNIDDNNKLLELLNSEAENSKKKGISAYAERGGSNGFDTALKTAFPIK